MKTSHSLANLALAGIAAGFLAHAVRADEAPVAKKGDPTMSAPAAPDSGAPAMAKAHDCKGHNDCKGMGGCKMTQKDLKKAAKKAGMSMEKAGKAHDCKGKNECKGLGGCKSK